MASRNSKSPGGMSQPEGSGKGGKAGNQNSQAHGEGAGASRGSSKRSSQGGEKKSTGSKGSK